jgi:hypothetical protein
MKIKDLSSSNQVAGEGILSWSIQDTHGASVIKELMGYHIPNAEVHLLSPQFLLNTISGKAIQTVQGIDIILNNGFNVNAKFCPQSNLLLIPLSLKNDRKYCFGTMLLVLEPRVFKKPIPLKQSCIKTM